MIDEILDEIIDNKVKEKITEMFEPLVMLKKYEYVDQLTIEEVCEVFRREPTEASKNWVREGCKRGEIPHIKVGDSYFFPKYQLAEMMSGLWKPEKVKKEKSVKFNLSAVARELV
ncbi:MAG TPA: helix-turn-helix domain-containing protein [Sphingobacteriaceae bacterium]